MKKSKASTNKTEEVDAFVEKLDYPFKAEVEAVRSLIKNVNKEITGQLL